MVRALLLTLAVSAPAIASAQSITIAIDSIPGREESQLNLESRPVSRAECDGDITVTLTLRGVNTSKELLDLWRGETCNTTTARAPDSRTCDPLSPTGVDLDISRRAEITLELGMRDLVDCNSATGEDVYFLAADASESTAEINNDWGVLRIRYEPDVPDKPENASGRDGENSVRITWDADETNSLDHYVLYGRRVEGGCPGGTPSEDGTRSEDSGLTELDSNIASSAGSASIRPSEVGAEPGDGIILAIASVDEAEQESDLAAVCVSVVPTQGFCDAYGGCPDDCAVTAPGAGRGAPPLGLAVLGLLFLLRRRRS